MKYIIHVKRYYFRGNGYFIYSLIHAHSFKNDVYVKFNMPCPDVSSFVHTKDV